MQTRTIRLFVGSAALWLTVGVLVALYLDISYAGVIDPVRATFSEYVHTGQGARLTGVAMLGIAFSSLATAGALWCTGGPHAKAGYWLVVVWGLGLAVLAVFPQEPADQALTWHGAIHRHAALAAMITLPTAGLLLAKRWPCLRPASVACLVLLAVFVSTFLVPDLRAYSGLAERFLLLADLAVLVLLLHRLRPAAAVPE